MAMMLCQPMVASSEEELYKLKELAMKVIQKEGYSVSEPYSSGSFSTATKFLLSKLSSEFSVMADADGVVFVGEWNNEVRCKIIYAVCKEYNIPTYTLAPSPEEELGYALVFLPETEEDTNESTNS